MEKINNITLLDKNFELLISEEEINSKITELARDISKDYTNSSNPPIIIGVMNGSLLFLSDLIRKLTINVELATIRISSYVGTTAGVIRELSDLGINISGRDIIIVDDIVDTGNSMDYLINRLSSESPASIRTCALFIKPSKFTKKFTIDYTAFQIDDKFIVGYGLDYNQLGRNLSQIYTLIE